VLGGTRALGRCAVPSLVSAGHDVSALARTDEKAAWVSGQGAKPVSVSMFDSAALSGRLRGHDAVVNLATAMPSTATFVLRRAWKSTERIRIEGSASVVNAAMVAGVCRLVQESVCMLYPDRGDQDRRGRPA
jgi:nucleoside-diphosphate-sugar epimerase